MTGQPDPRPARRPEDSRFSSATGREAALTRWAHEPNPGGATSKARAAFLERFAREADPEKVLSLEERAKRADRLMRAYMSKLSRSRRSNR